MKTGNKDTALRRAIGTIEEERQFKLPSNFAYMTMRRIEAEKRRKELRYRIITLLSTASVTIAGIITVALSCGKDIIRDFANVFDRQLSFSGMVPMLICLVFFASLNTILQKHFHTD